MKNENAGLEEFLRYWTNQVVRSTLKENLWAAATLEEKSEATSPSANSATHYVSWNGSDMMVACGVTNPPHCTSEISRITCVGCKNSLSPVAKPTYTNTCGHLSNNDVIRSAADGRVYYITFCGKLTLKSNLAELGRVISCPECLRIRNNEHDRKVAMARRTVQLNEQEI